MFSPTVASSGSFDCQSEHMRILSRVDYSHCRMATIPGPHLINACSTPAKHCVKGVGGNLFPSFPNSHFKDFISLGRIQWPVTYKHTPEPNFEFSFRCCFLLHWIFVAVCGLSVAAVGRDYSPAAVRGLLTAVASLVAEHGL